MIHGDITKKIKGVKHLSHVKIKCVETGKTIFCRIYAPGASQSREYSDFYRNVGGIETAICVDAYFQREFNIPYDDVRGEGQYAGTKEYNFVISPVGFCGKTWASLTHPEDGIRLGMQFAIISLFVGSISLLIGFFSLILGCLFIIISLISKAS